MNKTVEPLRLVIVGGGFAGLNLARNLVGDPHFDVTLIDKNNYNYFPPLLYQVATSFLDASSISVPFRKVFRDGSIRFRMATVSRVEPEKYLLHLNNGIMPYDLLVFASGGEVNFYGNENIRKFTIPMKTIDDAFRMRNALVATLEQATIVADPVEKRKLLTIVIAGGGPTGVEVAGMLAEMKRHVLPRDYPELKNDPVEFHIIDGGPVLLGPMSGSTHRKAHQILSDLGVNIRLNARVKDYDGEFITLDDDSRIATRTVIWAAGIVANKFDGIPVERLGPGRRMLTDGYGKVNGLQDVYAIGDIALVTGDQDYPHGHPQVAQPAIQMGKTMAGNLKAFARQKPMRPFHYRDKGDMAIIGRTKAVVDLFKHRLHISGFAGLFIWLFIHLISLVKFRNKLITLYDWTSAYIVKDRALRMIFRTDKPIEEKKPPGAAL